MALRLEIISNQREQLGPRASFVLGALGGTIGRALDNDWILPDTQRYLSAHHARFHARHGGYYLEDTSTNGVYVNEATSPQGRRGLYALQDGDVLRMGEYRIRVHLLSEDTLPPPGSVTMAGMPVDNIAPLLAVGHDTDDLGASLNIEALIPENGMVPGARPIPGLLGEAYGSATLSAQQRLTRLRAAARARLDGNAAPAGAIHNALLAFCSGAGIDPARVPMENEAQSLRLLGRLLREAVIGLKEILRTQQSFRDSYRLETEKPAHSPLERPTDEYLLDLINGHERHQFDAVMQLRECFMQAGAHDAAVDPALQSALTQFMAHLAPERMEAGAGAGSSWERYKEIYSHLLQKNGDELPPLFVEAIAQAYGEARSSSLPVKPRRK
jgi:predicted component of type VI protein secretion system